MRIIPTACQETILDQRYRRAAGRVCLPAFAGFFEPAILVPHTRNQRRSIYQTMTAMPVPAKTPMAMMSAMITEFIAALLKRDWFLIHAMKLAGSAL